MENIKGITLNQQLVDLLSIIEDNPETSVQVRKINEYIENLRKRIESLKEVKTSAKEDAQKSGKDEKGTKKDITIAEYKFLIDQAIDNLPIHISEDKIELLKNFYFENALNLNICNREEMLSQLQKLGFDDKLSEEINDSVQKNMKSIDMSAKPGILDMTPEDVRNLYNQVINGNYNRITMDTCGRYSDFVGVDGQTICDGNIERMMHFANKHNISTKINTFMMYSDFPIVYNNHLTNEIKNGNITEVERKQMLKDSLLKYVIEVGTRYGDKISAVDIFNELIYNPGTTEKEDSFKEYKLDENGKKISTGEKDKNGNPIYEEAGYVERSQTGWQKYLSLDDLCEMAVIARAVLPNATFTYNDWNWVIPEKRQAMIDMVNKIQQKQAEIIKNGGIYVDGEIRTLLESKGITLSHDGKLEFKEGQTIINNVGFEAHLNTETTPEQFEETVDDVRRQTGLPVEITEEDVAHDHKATDKEDKDNLDKKQCNMFDKIDELMLKGKIIGETIWSLGRASFTDKLYKFVTHASKLNDDFTPKTNSRTKIITIKSAVKNAVRNVATEHSDEVRDSETENFQHQINEGETIDVQ